MRLSLGGLGFALLVSVVFATLDARAVTPEETAAARTAAQGGLEAFNRGAYAEALDLLDRAESLVHAPSHLLFQARCHEKLGNLVQAREVYNKLIRENLATDASPAFIEAQRAARSEIAGIEPRIPLMTIVVKGEGASEAVVTVDGKPLAKAIVGIPFPINPGTHQIKAETNGGGRATGEISIRESQKERLELTLVPAGGNAATTTPATTSGSAGVTNAVAFSSTDSTTPARRGGWMKPVGWGALGLGAVGVGVGTYMYLFGASRKSDADAANKECAPNCSTDDWDYIDQLDADAEAAGKYSVMGFVGGGVGIAGGITLLLLAPKASAHARVLPWIGPNSVGVLGRF